MRSLFDAKINMLRTVAKAYGANQSRFDVIPVFPTTFAPFTSYLSDIETWLTVALADATLAAEIVNAQKKTLALATEKVAMPTGAYAAAVSNTELQQTMNVRASALAKEKKDRLPIVCKLIHTEANAVKVAAAPYNLTQALLDALEDALTAYETDANTPRLAHGEVKTGNQEIEKIIAGMDTLLTEQLDRLVSTLADSDAPLVSLWKTARTIIDPPTHHTTFTLTVKSDTGQPIHNARCALVKLAQEKILFTDATGVAHFPTIASGEWSVSVTAEGFQPFFLAKFKITKGEENTFDVVLTAL